MMHVKPFGFGKEVKLFADDMIIYTENPKDSTKKLLQLINVKKQDTEFASKRPRYL